MVKNGLFPILYLVFQVFEQYPVFGHSVSMDGHSVSMDGQSCCKLFISIKDHETSPLDNSRWMFTPKQGESHIDCSTPVSSSMEIIGRIPVLSTRSHDATSCYGMNGMAHPHLALPTQILALPLQTGTCATRLQSLIKSNFKSLFRNH
jgi:hypothetical protein